MCPADDVESVGDVIILRDVEEQGGGLPGLLTGLPSLLNG